MGTKNLHITASRRDQAFRELDAATDPVTIVNVRSTAMDQIRALEVKSGTTIESDADLQSVTEAGTKHRREEVLKNLKNPLSPTTPQSTSESGILSVRTVTTSVDLPSPADLLKSAQEFNERYKIAETLCNGIALDDLNLDQLELANKARGLADFALSKRDLILLAGLIACSAFQSDTSTMQYLRDQIPKTLENGDAPMFKVLLDAADTASYPNKEKDIKTLATNMDDTPENQTALNESAGLLGITGETLLTESLPGTSNRAFDLKTVIGITAGNNNKLSQMTDGNTLSMMSVLKNVV